MALKLHVPVGTTEANVGEHLYTADADGIVTVDDHDAAALLATPGFMDATPQAVAPVGFVHMIAPAGAASVSVNSVTYTVGEDGTVIVPADNELASHGFVPSAVPVALDLTPTAEQVEAAESAAAEVAPAEPVAEPVAEPEQAPPAPVEPAPEEAAPEPVAEPVAAPAGA